MIFVFHIVTVEVEEKPPSAKKVKKEKKKKIKFEQPAEEEVKGLKNRNFTCGCAPPIMAACPNWRGPNQIKSM